MERIGTEKDIVDEVFRITGAKMGSQDPIAVAAIFYSHKLQEAASNAAEEINRAAAGSRIALQSAEALIQKVEQEQFRLLETVIADKTQFREDHVRLFETIAADREQSRKEAGAERDRLHTDFAAERTRLSGELQRSIDRYIKVASRPVSDSGYRLVPAWFLLTAFFSGALVFAMAAGLLTGSTSWAHDAAIGRAFQRLTPKLDPAIRAKLIEAAEKNAR